MPHPSFDELRALVLRDRGAGVDVACGRLLAPVSESDSLTASVVIDGLVAKGEVTADQRYRQSWW